jgi:hypothetical protein
MLAVAATLAIAAALALLVPVDHGPETVQVEPLQPEPMHVTDA